MINKTKLNNLLPLMPASIPRDVYDSLSDEDKLYLLTSYFEMQHAASPFSIQLSDYNDREAANEWCKSRHGSLLTSGGDVYHFRTQSEADDFSSAWDCTKAEYSATK